MQVVANVVMLGLLKGVGKKSGKEYYQFKGVVVGCQEFDALIGVDFNKFITKEVFDELSLVAESGCDRFDCSMGISRSSVAGRDYDVAFNLFINGLPKEPEEEIVPASETPAEDKKPEGTGNVLPVPEIKESVPDEVDSKTKGKK